MKAQAVVDFISISNLPKQVVEQILHKKLKILAGYKENNIGLDAVTSEKLLKLFALYDKGTIVFGSVEEFNKWMGEVAFGLGNHVPHMWLDTVTGIGIIEEELKRIEYGDLS